MEKCGSFSSLPPPPIPSRLSRSVSSLTSSEVELPCGYLLVSVGVLPFTRCWVEINVEAKELHLRMDDDADKVPLKKFPLHEAFVHLEETVIPHHIVVAPYPGSLVSPSLRLEPRGGHQEERRRWYAGLAAAVGSFKKSETANSWRRVVVEERLDGFIQRELDSSSSERTVLIRRMWWTRRVTRVVKYDAARELELEQESDESRAQRKLKKKELQAREKAERSQPCLMEIRCEDASVTSLRPSRQVTLVNMSTSREVMQAKELSAAMGRVFSVTTHVDDGMTFEVKAPLLVQDNGEGLGRVEVRVARAMGHIGPDADVVAVKKTDNYTFDWIMSSMKDDGCVIGTMEMKRKGRRYALTVYPNVCPFSLETMVMMTLLADKLCHEPASAATLPGIVERATPKLARNILASTGVLEGGNKVVEKGQSFLGVVLQVMKTEK